MRLVERMLGARIQLLVKRSLCRRHGRDVASMEMRLYEQSSDVAVVRMFRRWRARRSGSRVTTESHGFESHRWKRAFLHFCLHLGLNAQPTIYKPGDGTCALKPHNRAAGLSSVCKSTYACLMAVAPVSTTSVSKITRPAAWRDGGRGSWVQGEWT